MKKTWLIGSALGGMIIAGSVALAATGARDALFDANGDGNVTKAEVTAALDKRFAELDKNGDGKITQEERTAARQARFDKHFAEMDKDNNGQISKAEMQAAHEARKERGSMRGPGHGDGKHHHWGMHHRGQHGGRMAMIDANKDGVVTKAEFQARALEKFDRLDANKDGTITAAERQAMRDAMKKRMQERMGNSSN